MELCVVRHGETEDNELGLISGAGRDVPLSEKGVRQSENLRGLLTPGNFDRVFCSPLRRALQTCAHAGFLTSDTVFEALVTEKGYGEFEGRKVCEYEEAVSKLSFEDLYKSKIGGCESFEQLQGRARLFIRQLEQEEGKRVVIFAHEAFNRALLATLSDIPFAEWLEIPQENADIARVVMAPAAAKL